MGKTTRAGDELMLSEAQHLAGLADPTAEAPAARSSAAAPRRITSGEQGFTLAGVLIILTIVMVFVAYTVPKQWSTVLQREREFQTIYVMRQYARACMEFQRKHNVWPTSIDQVKEARLPRFIRGGPKSEFADPLTGEVDWLIVPATAAQPGTAGVTPGGATIGIGRGNATTPGQTTGTTGTDTSGTNGTTGTNGQITPAGIPMKDYAGGPFVGVRPSKTGDSILEFRGAKTYEQWSFTALDLQAEIQQFNLGIQNSLQWK